MQVSPSIRYGVLFLVAVLAVGLLCLGVVRYQAEQRAVQFAASSSGESTDLHPTKLVQAPQPEPAVEQPKQRLIVHVAGAVAQPGIYTLDQGARLSDAITAAGGALSDGDAGALNLAAALVDGEKVYVYTKQEIQAKSSPVAAQGATKQPVQAERPGSSSTTAALPGKVNVNTASIQELDKLPGISPTTAKAIVDYRTKQGPFKRIEDLQAVKGIGPSTLSRLKPYLAI